MSLVKAIGVLVVVTILIMAAASMQFAAYAVATIGLCGAIILVAMAWGKFK